MSHSTDINVFFYLNFLFTIDILYILVHLKNKPKSACSHKTSLKQQCIFLEDSLIACLKISPGTMVLVFQVLCNVGVGISPILSGVSNMLGDV